MAAIIQYAFENQKQWETAGEPKLLDTATYIIELGFRDGKWHVEVLFEDTDDVPDNGLLAAKAVNPVPHKFVGYESLRQYEERKERENNTL